MPMLLRKLKKILIPQVTGRVGSISCRYAVKSFCNWMPFSCALSATSLPVEYMITLGWL